MTKQEKYKDFIKSTLVQFNIAYSIGEYKNASWYLKLITEEIKKLNK